MRVLYYEGHLVRSSPSSKIAMLRRFYLPNFARSIRICVTKVLPDYILIFLGTKCYNIGTVYLESFMYIVSHALLLSRIDLNPSMNK